MFPDEDFLPRAPDPEEIILDGPDENPVTDNPGHHGNTEAGAENPTETSQEPASANETSVENQQQSTSQNSRHIPSSDETSHNIAE